MKCEICQNEAGCIIRGKDVCKFCFGLFQKDNIYRNLHNVNIPNNFNILKKCKKHSCRNRVETEVIFKQEKQEIIILSSYCKECKTL
jgi:hypothetical protein